MSLIAGASPRGAVVDGFGVWWRIARASDIDAVEAELNVADRCELQAGGITLRAAVDSAVLSGGLTFTMVDHVDGDAPGGLFGVVPHDGSGIVWALTTPRIRRHRRRFLRISSQWLDWMHAACPVLANVVWAGNLQHIFWLLSLGFVIIAEREIDGEPFYEFVRLRKEDV